MFLGRRRISKSLLTVQLVSKAARKRTGGANVAMEVDDGGQSKAEEKAEEESGGMEVEEDGESKAEDKSGGME